MANLFIIEINNNLLMKLIILKHTILQILIK